MLTTLLACLVTLSVAVKHEGVYKVKDLVPVDINTVYPYNNPSETYRFYKKLPFCRSSSANDRIDEDKSVGSALVGDAPYVSPYRIHFKVPQEEPIVLCPMTLTQNDIKSYIDAISNDYLFTYFVDGLLVAAFVGEKEETHEHYRDHYHDSTQYWLFTHWTFNIEYNEGRIISVRLTTDIDKRKPLKYGQDITVQFTYSVKWKPTNVQYEYREFYHQRNMIRLGNMDVHWLSILNSFLLVVVLTGILSFIFLRSVKKQCARYDSQDLEDVDDPGWKQVHGDVFRPPPHRMFFASAVGTGTQLLALGAGLLVLSLIGTFYPGNRGALATAVILVYCFTAGVAGHVSGKLYVQMGGEKWATNAVLTACVFAVPFTVIFIVLNTISTVKDSTAALPFSYIAAVFMLWATVTFPLTIFGAYRVKSIPPKLDVPLKTNAAKREIPDLPWYQSSYFQTPMAGVLPFTAIYIELHYIFTAVFGHRVYTLFGILTLAFVMLLTVTAAVTIALTYFQLMNEDWKWWWRSFLTAGSTGLYIFGYAVFYYKYRSFMTGVLQTATFFGYTFAVSYAFFLMLGAVGWWCTFTFVKAMYAAIKLE